ncbi:MAG: hypothetical protein LBT40_09705 [Deltaproteobacteria bacterium]|nr:hypothetical protein [Deltaproteobacteria bacterium]
MGLGAAVWPFAPEARGSFTFAGRLRPVPGERILFIFRGTVRGSPVARIAATRAGVCVGEAGGTGWTGVPGPPGTA